MFIYSFIPWLYAGGTFPTTIFVGTSSQQNDFNKEIHKDKGYETIDNTYEDLSIEIPKAQTL